MEIWKPVKNYEDLYEVSNKGSIKTLRYSKLLKPGLGGNGYFTVSLTKDGKARSHYIHRLIAEHFLDGYFAGAHINHKNKDRTDNSLENLEWVTQAENNNHGRSKNYIITHPCGKQEKVFNLAKFCRQYNLHTGHMCYLAKGKLKTHKGFRCQYLD